MFKIIGVINYLVVVFLNAFTDLGHKIIIQNTIFKVYDGDMQIILTAIINALILLPFVMLFSPSGFLADRFPKNKIMEYSALLAVVLTIFITYSYYQGWFFTAFCMTFLLALQSAIYGPAKYGYIKELVGAKFISSGNGALQAVTTIAILSGIIFYTVLFEVLLEDNFSTKEDILKMIAPLGWLLVISSIIEWFLASKLPNKMIQESQKVFDIKKYLSGKYLRKNLKIVTRKKEVFEAILGLSLFWSISQVILAIFGEYAKSKLGVTNAIFVQGTMAMAGFGIVLGSILSASYSKYYVNSGTSSIGAIGMTIVVFIIPFSHSMIFLSFLFAMFGVFSGFIMVPLNSLIQLHSPRVHLGTVLAGNNFIQNIFMIGFLVLTTIFAYFGMDAEILFYMMGFVSIYLSYLLLKRYFILSVWAFTEAILRLRYNFTYIGLENFPKDGGILLLGNHVSWIDWIIIQIPIRKRLNFMMDKGIYNWKYAHKFFKKGEAIPVSPKGSKNALKEASKRLKNSKIVAMFPEGKITQDTKLSKIQRGYELISKDYDGCIIAFYIDGMDGSIFSKTTKTKPWFKREVKVYFSSPLPKEIKADELKSEIESLSSLV